jgi:hypothetical protein
MSPPAPRARALAVLGLPAPLAPLDELRQRARRAVELAAPASPAAPANFAASPPSSPRTRMQQAALFDEKPQWTGLEHFIGTCGHCGTTTRVGAVEAGARTWEIVEGPRALRVTLKSDGVSLVVTCPRCHARGLRLERVDGRETEHPCNAACMFAQGPLCECSCSGANHGAGFALMLERLGLLETTAEPVHD